MRETREEQCSAERALWRVHSREGSSCAAKGKVQVDGQVKLLPAPQLLPESVRVGIPK